MHRAIIITGDNSSHSIGPWVGEANISTREINELTGGKDLIHSNFAFCGGHRRDGASGIGSNKYLRVINVNLNHSSEGKQFPDRGWGGFDPTLSLTLARLVYGATSEDQALYENKLRKFLNDNESHFSDYAYTSQGDRTL